MAEQLSVCEQCGSEFPPTNEVTSSRILCPPCAERRRAQLRAARTAGAGAAAGDGTAGRDANAPPRAVAEHPPVARQRAAPAPPRATPRYRAQDESPTREDRAEAERRRLEHLELKRQRDARQARLVRIGWIVTGSLMVVTLLVLLLVRSEQQSRREEIAAYEKGLDDFRANLLRVDLADEGQLRAAKDLVAKDRKTWKGTRIDGDVAAQLSKINDALQTIAKTRSLKEQLDGMEKQLAAEAGVPVLAKLFATSRDAEIAMQADEAGGALKARYERVVKDVADRYVAALRAEATAAAGASTAEGLAPLGALEDTLRTLYEAAVAKNDVDAQAVYRPLYVQAVAASNDAATRLFDQAYVARVPWKDLLADVPGWTVVPSSSFRHQFGAGLTLSNEAGDAASSGGLSYTPGNAWRDYVLDVEVQLDSGNLGFYARIDGVMDSKQVPAFTFGTKTPNVQAEYGTPVAMTIRVIGKSIAVFVGDQLVWSDEDIALSKSRKGEPGIVAQVGTAAKITRLRARLLR